MSDYTIYPELVDEVSILNDDKIRTPIHRISLVEESDFSLFNNPSSVYMDETSKIKYILNKVALNEETEESVVITLIDSDYPERTFDIDIQIHHLNSAFLISQMLKAPMFIIAPSDDTLAALGDGPFTKKEIHVTVEAPVRKTPEFSRISKAIFELSKQSTPVLPQVMVSSAIVDEVRGDILETVLGLMDGKPESLVKAYSFIEPLTRINSMDIESSDEVSDEDKKALVMKDMLLKLEHSTHPISISHLFSETENARQYIRDIEEFESIANASEIDLNFGKELDKGKVITPESSDEDVIAYINSPIELKFMPEKIQTLMMGVEIDYFWDFKWHSALEENVNFKELRSAGDFFVSMLLVISVRMARLKELYDMSGNADLSPIANLTNGLTQQGENFSWIVKQGVNLLAKGNDDILLGLLTITPDSENASGLNGPATLLMHAIGHAAIELEMPLHVLEANLKAEPRISDFVSKVFDLKEKVPAELISSDEDLCFIKAFVFSYMQESGTITEDYAKEILSAVKTLSEMTVMRVSDSSINSEEWNNTMKEFYTKFLR